jgi:ATP-dependent DNA helicase DinG
VLLGVASFWQGVDVQGEALRLVVITRLPFEPPDRPITEARAERLRERGEDPFRRDQLPRAIIRFRQGFGRLIRSQTDRGRVVVLDPRIVSKGYGRQFLKSLPEGVRASVVDDRGEVEPLPLEDAF